MDGNYKAYDYVQSSARIKDILDQPAGTFQEVKDLPDRDRLTFTNGFYGYCSAVYIDIRDSSGLTAKHQRPRLAKIYRAFISEMVAVLNSSINVREVNIVGDCVWAVYNTPLKSDINATFSVTAKANTAVKLLNYHLRKKSIDPIKVGIGVDYGRVLMVKAGFNGSGINDVVYMGDAVNRAAHLAHEAGRGWANTLYVGGLFHGNLSEYNQGLLNSQYVNGLGTVYVGDTINTEMNTWLEALP